MNPQQWDYFVDWIYRVEGLLEKIEENTRTEKIEEPKSKITGFSAGGDRT